MVLSLSLALAASPTLLWEVEVGPIREPGLHHGPEGLAVRTAHRGWVGLTTSGEGRDVDHARLGWWDQVPQGGVARFGEDRVALVHPSSTRLITVEGEVELPGAHDGRFVGTDLALQHEDRLTLYDRAGDPRWSVPGRWTRWEDRWVRLHEEFVLLDDAGRPAGAIPHVKAAGVAGLGPCLVILPAGPDPVRCVEPDREHWSLPLAGSRFDRPPVRGDVDGDGRTELVLLTGDRRFVIDATGTVRLWWEPPPGVGAPLLLDVDGEPGAEWLEAGRDGWVRAWKLVDAPPPEPSTPAPPVPWRSPLAGRGTLAARCGDELSPHACTQLAKLHLRAGDEDAAAAALDRACAMGAEEACTDLAARPALAARIGPGFWRTGCELGLHPLCAGWLERLAPEQRHRAARLACERGYLEACDSPLRPEPPPPTTPVAMVRGRITLAGAPLPGAWVRSSDGGSTWTDRRGRFTLAARESLLVEHPLLGGTVELAGEWEVDLEAGATVEGRVEGIDGAGLLLEGCDGRAVRVGPDGRFLLRGVPAGSPCALRGIRDGVRLEGRRKGSELVVRPVPAEPVPRILFRGPDGEPLRQVLLPEGRTDDEGFLAERREYPICNAGITHYEGYREVCHSYAWPVVLTGADRYRARSPFGVHTLDGDRAWLTPGRWTLIGIGDGHQGHRDVQITGPAEIHVSARGDPVPRVRLLDPTGRPLYGWRAGEASSGPDGTLPLPGHGLLEPLELTGPGGERVRLARLPRDGVAVIGRGRPLVQWRATPAGLAVERADETLIDLHPGDVLREACGYRVTDLSDAELAALQRGQPCPARVWRAGREHTIELPVWFESTTLLPESRPSGQLAPGPPPG